MAHDVEQFYEEKPAGGKNPMAGMTDERLAEIEQLQGKGFHTEDPALLAYIEERRQAIGDLLAEVQRRGDLAKRIYRKARHEDGCPSIRSYRLADCTCHMRGFHESLYGH